MKKSIKKRWVKALRSGDYVQGARRLKGSDGSYCCLGVLCDLAREDHPEWVWHNGFFITGFGPANDIVLPKAVKKWAGLDARSPVVAGDELATYNDGMDGPRVVEPHTFEQIADLIEQHL